MEFNRIDESIDLHFNPKAFEKRLVPESHEVAALIDSDCAKEILKELPSIGPVTYLSKLGILISEVEKDGYDYLLEQQGVFGIADAEARCEMPQPEVLESVKSHSSRDLMRGPTKLFNGYEGKGIKIGVIDSGIDSTHPELKGRILNQVNCIGDSLTGDTNGHGTHVAGSIIGENIGVASEAEILDLRVFGTSSGASISSILMALDQCISREVDIVNMSLGSAVPSYVLESAVNQVSTNGIILCAAAGNSGPYSETINSPSSAQLAISVAAADASKHVSRFSSRGPCRWNSWQKPDCAGFGENVYSAKNGGGYTVMSGTSMASPGVAGVAACVLQYQHEHSGSFAFVDWLLRNGGVPVGQQLDEVGCGFISLDGLEQYVGNGEEMSRMDSKKKGKNVGKRFFVDLIKCKNCNSPRAVHQIRHRKDGSLVFVVSCRACRKAPQGDKIDSEEIELQEWQHKHILNHEIIKALKRCGKCGKEGLVVVGNWESIKVNPGHPKHSKAGVGCLYCQVKGQRKIPLNIARLWSN